MSKRVLASILCGLTMVLGASSPALADHEGYRGEYGRGGCGESGGGCGNERDEEYGNGSCKYFCPAFDRSPVEDSFNPVVCLPGATCYTNPDRNPPNEGSQDGPERSPR